MTDDDYWQQGTKRIEEHVRAVNEIVDLLPAPRRKHVKDMIESPLGGEFFVAPASTRRAYHNAFPAGLVEHSLNVVRNAVSIAETIATGRWPAAKIMFCALFHDLGKAGDGRHPYYVLTDSRWKSERGEHYEVNRETGFQFMPPTDMSLYLLQSHGITLDVEEYLAIRLSDGPAADGNAGFAFNEPDLSVIINMADTWAMRQEKHAAR